MEFGLTWAKLDEMQYVTEAEKLAAACSPAALAANGRNQPSTSTVRPS